MTTRKFLAGAFALVIIGGFNSMADDKKKKDLEDGQRLGRLTDPAPDAEGGDTPQQEGAETAENEPAENPPTTPGATTQGPV